MRALVLADGDRPSAAGLESAWPGWATDVGLVIAADGGARLAADLGLAIDGWIGDGDSVGPAALAELAASGVPVERASPDKDESDTELALLLAIRRGATSVVVLGALGGRRLDHALANIGLLAHEAARGLTVELLDERTRVRLLRADGGAAGPVTMSLAGRRGDVVSLLPWGGRVDGVTTRGLRYALADEPLPAGPARGLSNVRVAEQAAVTVREGRLLVLESPATLGP